ncbi:hypothetical protein [Deinococcus sp.]|uniref:hypothetical protein n=1 Tax=Deinococcus sp. TaxID=47478 RepID=UPI003B58C112
MTDVQEKFVLTDDELFRQVASSLRLEGFETTPERLRALEQQAHDEKAYGKSRQRRKAI